MRCVVTLRAGIDLLREAWNANDRSVVSPGLHALVVHGANGWARRSRGPLRRPARIGARAAYFLVRNVYGIDLPATVTVGRNFRIAHAGGVVIHPDTVFGDNCIIRQNVTIGAAGTGDFHTNHPTFGDRVDIGAGAVVMGRIHVGDDVTIGPNTVVMTDVPARTMVVNPPARRMSLPGGTPPAQPVPSVDVRRDESADARR